MKWKRILAYLLASSVCMLVARAQYNVTILALPAGIPDNVNTSVVLAFNSGLNNKGQVAGAILQPGVNEIPVLWTNGVPVELPVPTGFRLITMRGLNDAGQVLAQIGPDPALASSPNASQVIVWNGTTPTVLPHYPAVCSQNTNAATYISNAFGINRAGHITGATQKADSCGWGWIWDGSTFSVELTQANNSICIGGPSSIGASLVQPFGINDADHVATDLIDPYPESPCSSRAAILRPGRPFAALSVPSGDTVGLDGNNINNLDQTYGISASGTFFWNGSALEEVVPGNFLSLNNMGQALLLKSSGGLFLWKNGSQTEITFQSPITGFGSPAALNDGGQIALRVITAAGLTRIGLLTPSGACAADISAQVTVTRSGFRLNHTNGHFTQTVTVTNNTASFIQGPISVVFDNVPNSATLFGLSGTTVCAAPEGGPFITSTPDLGSNGGSFSVALEFIDTANSGITYNTRVLAGPGGR